MRQLKIFLERESYKKFSNNLRKQKGKLENIVIFGKRKAHKYLIITRTVLYITNK